MVAGGWWWWLFVGTLTLFASRLFVVAVDGVVAVFVLVVFCFM